MVGVFAPSSGFGGSGPLGPISIASVAYALQDQYTTALAAGSVNATNAEPGPGTRTVTDTNVVLSITGGQASIATGGVGVQNPRISYGAFTRVFGKTLLWDWSFTTASLSFRWAISDGGNPELGITPIVASRIDVSTATTTVTVAAAPSTATTYRSALVLRAAGGFMFIKGGVYANWQMLYLGTLGNAASPVVNMGGNSATAVGVFDNVRIPQDLITITPLCYDTFTRSNGALGNSETAGPDAQTTPALAWTGATYTVSTNTAINTPTTGADVVVNGAFAADTDWNKGAGWTIAAGTAVATAASSDITAIVAPLTLGVWYQTAFTQGGFGGGTVNVKLGTTAFPTHAANGTFTETGRATSTALALTGAALTDTVDNFSALPLTLSTLFASVSASTADILADVNVTLVSATDGKPCGLVLNLDSTSSPANFIIVYLDGNGNCKADECVAGVYTNKISGAVTYAAAAVLRAERAGTDLRVFYNNIAVGSLATMTANTNTKHGMFNTSPVNILDVFTIWARGTSNEYSILDTY